MSFLSVANIKKKVCKLWEWKEVSVLNNASDFCRRITNIFDMSISVGGSLRIFFLGFSFDKVECLSFSVRPWHLSHAHAKHILIFVLDLTEKEMDIYRGIQYVWKWCKHSEIHPVLLVAVTLMVLISFLLVFFCHRWINCSLLDY